MLSCCPSTDSLRPRGTGVGEGDREGEGEGMEEGVGRGDVRAEWGMGSVEDAARGR